MRQAFTIARDEWRRLWRERAARGALAVLLLLWAMAAFTAWDRQQDIQADRSVNIPRSWSFHPPGRSC